jgi:hypothetical protein
MKGTLGVRETKVSKRKKREARFSRIEKRANVNGMFVNIPFI